MARIRKINVSQVEGNNDGVLPEGTIVAYDFNGEYRLRVHDGVTAGGVPFPNAPSIVHDNDINITVDSGDSSSYTWNFGQTGTLTAPGMAVFGGTDGIVVDNLNEGIAALFNNGDVYITGGESLRFTGLDNIEGESSSVLRFWNGEGRHSSGNDATELVTLNVGNDADSGDPTLGFFKIITEKQVGGEKEWKFDADGVLTLPTGGDIKDSEGNSVLGGDNNVWVQTFETQSGAPTDIVGIAISVEYDVAGNVIALFSHFNDDNSSSYYSVGKYTTTGAKIWTARFDDEFNTDGWGLAVDNDSDSIYVAGETEVESGQVNATLTKIDSTDGSVIWSKIYDFGFSSQSSVVDVASDGDPIMVGYASNGTDNYVATTKVDAADGSVIWSKTLDGQGDEEAYGMAVGPTGEVVAIGFMDQLTTVLESYPVTPQTGSGMEVLVINRSDLSNDTFTDSWKVAGTGIAEYADVTFINSYSGLTSTVRQGSGAVFEISQNDVSYGAQGIQNAGTDYLPGHKIRVLGTDLGGATPVNDCIITVDSIDPGGAIFEWSVAGVAVPADYALYTVTGTNYLTGTGLVFSLQLDSGNTYTIHPFTFQNVGANYVDGDVVVIPGTQLGGTSPANDLTATVSVTDGGAVTTFSLFSGTQQTSTYRILVSESEVNFSGTGTWTLNDVTVDQNNRMLIVKYNSAGAIQWQKAVQFDADEGCRGADADIDADGNIYVCGNYDTQVGVAMNLVKFNSSGVKQWSRRIVGNCVDFATSVVVGPDNNLYLTGVTTTPNAETVTWVVAKYNTTGSVVWQRLIENTASWTFTGSIFFENAGGSNIAVSPDYVLLGGGFGTFENDEDPTATVVQIDTNGTLFSIGNWALTAASFTGNLDDSASDITVVNAGKANTDNAENITTSTVTLTTEVSGFLIGTLYTAPDGDNSLVNGEYSVSLGNTGTVTLPAGGTISEGVVTSNPTIQLTPASPDVASQKLVIKGGIIGTSTTQNGITVSVPSNTWTQGNVDYVYVESLANADQTLYWWIYPEGAGLTVPSSGTVTLDEFGQGDFTFTLVSDDYEFTVRVSPEEGNYGPNQVGVESILINSNAPTFASPYHLHLTTGDLTETSIFLGTDDHNVRTTTNGNMQITTPNDINNVWEFDATGDLTIPGNIRSEGNIDIEINLADSTLRRWSFGEDGALTLPTGGHIGPSGGKGAGTTYGAANDHLVSLTSYYNSGLYSSCVTAYADGTLNITAYNDGGPNPAKIWTFANDGIVTLPNGMTINSTGDLGSNAFVRIGGNNTSISIDDNGAPPGIVMATDITGTGNYWLFSSDGITSLPGDLELNSTGNIRSENAINIDINLSDSTLRRWSFGEDGNLNIPGDIVDSTGVNQTAQRVEGSWTVTTGTNTYSFTVPMDGTYVMWVKGNIPNGIITWNATLSVTNSNVPAIGTQYAWNYTGGGSPILLTAIPDQIKGTAGGISTDATYVGTTSNRFDFGIANTSGSAQTVYYGYTKI
jgi:hypothetical protein